LPRSIPAGKASLKSILRAFGRASQAVPWNSEESTREELFSIERLEQHAESLAAAQGVFMRGLSRLASRYVRKLWLAQYSMDSITADKRAGFLRRVHAAIERFVAA